MKRITLLLFIFLLLSSAVLFAGENQFFQTGDVLPVLKFQDQFETPQIITEKHQLVLFSREMSSNDIVHDLMEAEGAKAFTQKGALFAADISKMPSLITRFIAMPNMRKYDYLMFLDLEGDLTKKFPFQKGKVTMMFLTNLKVTKIVWATSKEDVITAVKGLPTIPQANQ